MAAVGAYKSSGRLGHLPGRHGSLGRHGCGGRLGGLGVEVVRLVMQNWIARVSGLAGWVQWEGAGLFGAVGAVVFGFCGIAIDGLKFCLHFRFRQTCLWIYTESFQTLTSDFGLTLQRA